MNIKDILTAQEAQKLFLLGNEAAVRGALEAGVAVASTYPGTPSSEIGDIFSKIAREAAIYFEFSTNEKVALEVAAAASASGVRSFTFMKHVGLNVASDSLMSVVYSGVNGGMVILSADDPSMFSSQNEQDNRHYARLANIPMLEPSNPQEIKDLMRYGYQLSEEHQIPVLIRTTTRVSHMRGIVELDSLDKSKRTGFFHKDPERFVPVPEVARVNHGKLINKIKKLQIEVDKSSLNQVFHSENSQLGIITSGSAFNYVMDVVEENDLPVKVLKLTFSFPFPEKKVLEFAKSVDQIMVVEEVDPVMEKDVLSVLGKHKFYKKVYGKLDETLPPIYEFSPKIVLESIKKVLKIDSEKKIGDKNVSLPKRPPTLCPGCPHRAVYFALKRSITDLKLKDVIFPTDIGCYTLGIEAPYEAGDYLLSMGSSIGTACGFSRATNQKVVCFIGDSTFFHAGIPPLVNAVHNKEDFVVVILDNRTTAMTGGQPHPGLPVDGMGEQAPAISIEDMVKAVGAGYIKIVNPLNLKKSEEVFKQALQYPGVSVVISKYPCMLIKSRGKKKSFQVEINEDCDNCMICLEDLSCPAIYQTEKGAISIDTQLCRNCSICIQACPENAIGVRKK